MKNNRKGKKIQLNNNKIIIAIVCMVIVVVGIGCLIFKNFDKDGEKGSFNEMTYYSDNYQVSVKSKTSGHPQGKAKFSVNATIDNYKYNGKTYSADFDIEYYDIIEHKASIDYPNISSYPIININGKEFRYEVNESDILLIYQPNSLDCYVTIKVIINPSFSIEDGNIADVLKISIDNLSNRDIVENINFELSKK